MSKVIKSIKRLSFSTNRTGQKPDTSSPRGTSPRLKVHEERKDDTSKSVVKSTEELRKSKIKSKKDNKDRKVKDKKTKRKIKKGEESSAQVSSPRKRRRRRVVKNTSTEEEEGLVARENETSDQSEVPMKQGEFWEEYSCDEKEDFVGSFDFQALRDSDELELVNFSCLSPEEIIAAQKRQIQQVADLLVISASNASNLLCHYHWKTEVLFTRYFDDPQSVVKEAGLVNTASDGNIEADISGTEECLICNDEADATQSCSLLCAHRICNDCWSAYLSLKINEGEVIRINCPAISCTYAVPDEVVRKLVDKDHYEKYVRFVTRSFVEDNAHVTWCPAPRCGNAITTDMMKGQIVQCTCGFRFCFQCHHEAHAPATCEQVKNWLTKCNDESETGHWLAANTRDCPVCHVSVEKNAGCNHMTCKCHHEFCWLCNRAWKGHSDFYACERFEKLQKKKEKREKNGKKSKKHSKMEQEEKERRDKRMALERYLHYYSQYLHHDGTSSKAAEYREKSQAKIDLLRSQLATLAEVKFIETATDILLECRNIIKYSNVFSFYLDDYSREKPIFTFLREELEKTVTQLAAVLESPSLLNRRTETIDLTKLAQIKKDNLLRAVDNGLVNNSE